MRLRRSTLAKALFALSILMAVYAFRFQILRGAGHFLIRQDEPSKADAIIVLSGNPFDRGKKAAELFKAGWSPRIVVTGGEKSALLDAYGIHVLSCEVTRRAVINQGVDSSAIETLCEGSSTWEEYEAIKAQCKARGWDKIMVVSSLFHTRRINHFLRGGLAGAGIEMVLVGAPESAFDEEEWWKKEEGLIFLNNEYIKFFYYWMKY